MEGPPQSTVNNVPMSVMQTLPPTPSLAAGIQPPPQSLMNTNLGGNMAGMVGMAGMNGMNGNLPSTMSMPDTQRIATGIRPPNPSIANTGRGQASQDE